MFYPELDSCCVCGIKYPITKHEIFAGRNRQNSMKYGFVLPLCLDCHRTIQNDKDFNQMWYREAQTYFEENYGSREDFIKVFRKNYK